MPTRSKKRSKKFVFNPAVHGPVALAIFVVLVVGFLAGVSITKEEPKMLFVQQALTGSFRPDTTASGSYTLTFIGVKPYTLLFTDRPHRTVGSWTMNDFVTRWNKGADSFAEDAPNAVLLSHDPVDNKEYAVVVELKNPVFNAFAGTLIYSATILKDIGDDDLVPSPERHMEEFPQVLRSPALFIDDWGGWGM
jgi:hypothetical protein